MRASKLDVQAGLGAAEVAAVSAQDLGQLGEDLAVAELARQGLEILARNWRCRWGELDIVALDRADDMTTVVFCEVKCRRGWGYGAPLESITQAKLRRLRQLAGQWLISHPMAVNAIRIDGFGIVVEPGRAPVIDHVLAIA